MKNIFGYEGLIAINPLGNKISVAQIIDNYMCIKYEITASSGFRLLPLNSKFDLDGKIIRYDSITNCNDANLATVTIGNSTYVFSEEFPSKWLKELNRYSSRILKEQKKLSGTLSYLYDAGVSSPIDTTVHCTGIEIRSDKTVLEVFESNGSTVIKSNRRLTEYTPINPKLYDITFGVNNTGDFEISIAKNMFDCIENENHARFQHFAYIVSDSFKTLTRAMGIITTNYPSLCLNFIEDRDLETMSPLRRYGDNHIICLQCAREDIIDKFLEILEGNFRVLAFTRTVALDGTDRYTDFSRDDNFEFTEIFSGTDALEEIYHEFVRFL